MALKTVLESLDEVSEAFRGEYKEVDYPVGPGKTEKRFVLSLDDVDSHPVVRNLKNAYDRVKKDKQELSTQVTTLQTRVEGLPDDFNADAYEQLKAAAEGRGGKPTDEQLQEARRQAAEQAQRKFQKDLDAVKERNTFLESHVQNGTLKTELRSSLIKANIAPEYLEATEAMLLSRGIMKVVEENGKFSPIVETDIGDTTVEKFVMDWADSEAGKPFIAKATGGNAPGNNGRGKKDDNPFDTQGGKRKVNLTELEGFIKADPAKARSLAKQAGWPDQRITW